MPGKLYICAFYLYRLAVRILTFPWRVFRQARDDTRRMLSKKEKAAIRSEFSNKDGAFTMRPPAFINHDGKPAGSGSDGKRRHRRGHRGGRKHRKNRG